MALTKLDPSVIGQDSTGAGKITSAGGSLSIDSAGNVKIANNTANTIAITSTGVLTFSDASTQTTAASGFGFKNRIINGAMVIDQRNAGAAVAYGSTTVAGNYYGYNIDRWWAQSYSTAAGNGAAFTIQQSSVAPAGFASSMAATVTSAQATLQNDSLYRIQQIIEGYNVADLGWGTSSASSATLSFWVRSSLTGTFTGVVSNDVDYSYSFTYTITSSNVWQYVSVTIPGATAGTWPKTTGKGMLLVWCLGAYSTRLNTANTWTASASYQGAVGQTNLMATVGSTFYITGVQLEKGSTATSFDYRPYGQELNLCMRYYQIASSSGAMVGTHGYVPSSGVVYRLGYEFPVYMRATPTVTLGVYVWDGSAVVGSLAFSSNYTNYQRMDGDYTCAAGLTTGRYAKMYNGNLTFNAEM
jgi:hypothetical protein